MISRVSLSSSEKMNLFGNLATMLAAGIPLLEVVNSIMEDTSGPQLKILAALKDDLMQGKQIYSSFSQFPRVFDKVTINLLKASEEAGTLETVLKDLRDHVQKEMEFTDKIKFALLYPSLILVVFTGMLLTILIVVVPRIATVFSRLKVKMPLPTRILIFVSNLLLKQTVYLFGGIGLVVGLVIILYKTKRRFLLEMFYRLPLVSRLIKEIDLTRFTRSMYLLLSSGLPITSALELSQEVVMRAQTAKIISKSRDMVLSGKKFTEGLRAGRGIIPSFMIKLTEAGEKSGSLDKSMADISAHLDYQVSNTLKTLTAVMEPILLVVVGISVGGMMMAIIAPIYGLIGQVSSR